MPRSEIILVESPDGIVFMYIKVPGMRELCSIGMMLVPGIVEKIVRNLLFDGYVRNMQGSLCCHLHAYLIPNLRSTKMIVQCALPEGGRPRPSPRPHPAEVCAM